MKTITSIRVLISLLAVNAGVLWGAPTGGKPAGTDLPAPTPYAVVSSDAHSRVWERTVYERGPSGQAIPSKNRYVELATGLNYQKDGRWVESKEEIELFPGGAIARQGQHQVIFANNLATVGAIDMQTPDGRRMRSHVLGLSYFDTTSGQSVLIAQVKDSQGQLYPPNVVIYPDAFTDFKADVCYTYTKAGFEQDIILHERPPGPEAYGLNPATTKLQVLTEFLNPPQPVKRQTTLKTRQGDALDEDLDFGAMRMGRGKAFSLEQGGGDIPVGKQWLKLEGRDFLVEEVAVADLEEEMQALPAAEGALLNPAAGSARHVVSKQRRLPALPLVQAGTNRMQLAGLTLPAHGLVLDYQTINNNQTNYTFQGDTTYYISGSYFSSGTNIFEGGTVIKFATNGSISIVTGPGPTPSINWKAGAYRPVIFTAKDDNTVGDIISGSTGNPTGYYGSYYYLLLAGFSPSAPLTGLRMSYAKTAIESGSVNIYDAQFINCQNGLNFSGATVFLGNALFANTVTNFIFQGSATVNAQNTTFSGSLFLAKATTGSSLALTNCILANVTNLVSGSVATNGNYNGFFNSPPFGTGKLTNSSYPFQSVGAGSYYLANGCNFTNAGTSSSDSTLLADLLKKTTHPPFWLTNTTVSVNTNLNPQAARDTQTAPDLGYHYDPIDYLADQWAMTNATLTLTNGVAIATCNEAGFLLQDGSAIISIGTPILPNWLVRYSSVQEQAVSLSGTNSGGITVLPAYTSAMPSAQYRFTKFACPAGGGNHLYDYAASSCSNLLVQDCEFWGGQNTITGASNTTATLRNNLFYRSVITAAATNLTSTLNLTNNLIFGGLVSLVQPTNTVWSAFNNDFDSCTITNSTLTNGYNAYLNCSGRFYPTNSYDVVSSGTLTYKSGPLGAFYQLTSSALIDKGNTNANLLGLYHYTTTTSEVKETNSIVDIGYHYVAVDTYGNPVDTNGNGIPDYWEDANGNGLVDAGEMNWGLAILTQSVSQVVLQGTNVTFAVTAGGIAPLSYQWYFNATAIAATNATLTLDNVQTDDAGNYYVIVTNSLGSATSSIVTLTVLAPPLITIQPTNLMVVQGSNATFSVTATGAAPLEYQWWFNGTNQLSGETNASLTLSNAQLTNAGNYSVVVTNLAGEATSSNAILTVQVTVPMMAIGGERIMALTGSGDVVSWGGNKYGELGDYTYLDSTNPVHVVGLTNIVKIASMLNHSLAIDSNGALWAWGDNSCGQLGDGTTDNGNYNINLPEQVVASNVTAIATGNYHSLFIKSDGSLWAMGDNSYGELGDGTTDNGNYNINLPEQVVASNVTAVAAGIYYSLFLKGSVLDIDIFV